MFYLKLHKWLYSLTVLASLISYSGNASTTTFVSNTTEWIQIKETRKQLAYYVNYNKILQTKDDSFSFYKLQYFSFKKKTEDYNHILFIKQNNLYNHFKTGRLYSILKAQLLINTVNSTII